MGGSPLVLGILLLQSPLSLKPLQFCLTLVLLGALVADCPYASVTSTAKLQVISPSAPPWLNTAPLGPLVSVRAEVVPPVALEKSTFAQALDCKGDVWQGRGPATGVAGEVKPGARDVRRAVLCT